MNDKKVNNVSKEQKPTSEILIDSAKRQEDVQKFIAYLEENGISAIVVAEIEREGDVAKYLTSVVQGENLQGLMSDVATIVRGSTMIMPRNAELGGVFQYWVQTVSDFTNRVVQNLTHKERLQEENDKLRRQLEGKE